ncbi:MAG: segregation/condensation protein A [Lachnospiraceae bacterium]|jgi:segregation and condensation protein A|nr:segregation/condensation protein A [Lachnospiraceae bacterium]
MALPIKLEVFEGPLDLLLHLIDKNKIDIYDIPIVEITNQYMDYIHAMQEADLNLMSEFLVMAATLLEIKCKMLLPVENDEGEEQEDPRASLVEQLLEYKMYKNLAFELRDLETEGALFYYKEKTLPGEVADYVPPIDLDALLSGLTLRKLSAVFEEVMRRGIEKIDPVRSKFGQIERDEVTIEDKLEYIIAYAKNHPSFGFRALLTKQKSRAHVVVTFLAILELVKEGALSIEQDKPFNDIILKAVNTDVDISNIAETSIG